MNTYEDNVTYIELHGYEGTVRKSNGHVGQMPSRDPRRGTTAEELRRYAEFVLALAEESERVLKEYDHTPSYIEVYYSHVFRDWIVDAMDVHGHYVSGTMDVSARQSDAIFKATFESPLPVNVYTKAGDYKKTLLFEPDTGERKVSHKKWTK